MVKLRNRSLYMKIVSIISCLVSLNPVLAQLQTTPFKAFYEQSFYVSSSKSNTCIYEAGTNKELVKLLNKENWTVSDLIRVDCLIEKASNNPSDSLNGLLFFIGGRAYSMFDDDIKTNLYQKAYLHFESQNDVEGTFFCLNELFTTTIKISEFCSENSTRDIFKSFQELALVAQKTEYVPVQLSFYESKLMKIQGLKEDITISMLDYIADFADLHSDTYPQVTRDLFSALGNAYYQKGNIHQGVEYFHKAIHLAKPLQYQYHSFYAHLGKAYFESRELDSAKYYFEKAYHILQKKPKNKYTLSSKSLTEYNLGKVHKELDEFSEAFYYTKQSNLTKRELLELPLNTNWTYAYQKLEAQKKQIKLNQIDFELINKQRTQVVLISSIVFSLVMICVLFHLYQKKRQLQKKATALAKDRERLLQIISHDLVSPLQVFATAGKLLPKLIAKKKLADVEKVQESLSVTSIAFQNVLNNLFAWNEKIKTNQEQEKSTEINITNSIEQIVATYTELARNKHLSLNIERVTDLKANLKPMKFGNLSRNLIYNAVKHGASQSCVLIKLKKVDKTHFHFCCQNTISAYKHREVENLVMLMNSHKHFEYTGNGFGLELIFDAIYHLNASIAAELKNGELNICCTIPLR